MTIDEPEKPKRFSQWNPLQPLETHDDAVKAAKSGVWICAFLGGSYIIQMVFVYYTGQNTFGETGDLTNVISNIVGIALAALLAWRIWGAQGFWATLLTAAWFVFELVLKVGAIASGQQKTNVGWIFMFSALTIMAILAVRGSWKLRGERKAATIQP